MDYQVNKNFTLYIYTGTYLNPNFIQYGKGSVLATDYLENIEPGEIIVNQFTSSSKKVGAQDVNLTINLSLTNTIYNQANGGELSFLIPQELQTSLINCVIQSITDGANEIKQNFSCQISSDFTTLTISYSNADNILNLYEYQFSFIITNLSNPYDNRIIQSFEIKTTGTVDSVTNIKFDQLYSTLSYSATELNEIKINNITRSTTILYSPVIASFDFQLSSSATSGGAIQIDIQNSNEFVLHSGVAFICYERNQNVQISCQKDETTGFINFVDICNLLGCSAGNSFNLSIEQGIRNKEYIQPSNSANYIRISLLSANSFQIDNINTTTAATPALVQGSLTVVNMSRSITTIYSNSEFVITFKMSSFMSYTNNYINITFPTDLFLISSQEEINCQVNNSQISSTIIVENNSIKAIIQSICNQSGCISSESITISIQNLRNPMDFFTDDIELPALNMTTYYIISNTEYQVDSTQSKIASNMYSLQSSSLTLFPLTSSLLQSDSDIKLLFIYKLSSPVISNSQLIIHLPIDFINEKLSYAQCGISYLIGLKNFQWCKLVDNTLTLKFGVQYEFPLQIISFEISGLHTSIISQQETFTGFKTEIFGTISVSPISITNSFQTLSLYPLTSTCNSPCSTCLPTSPSLCLSCTIPSSYPYYYNYSCSDDCPIGTFRVKESPFCYPCFGSCEFCEYGEEGCINDCQQGNPVFQQQSECAWCDGVCESCEQNGKCTHCSQFFIKNLLNQTTGQCIQSCSEGWFSSNSICVQCDKSCLNCDGEGEEACTECNKGYYLEYGKCILSCNLTYQQVVNNSICLDVCQNDRCMRCDPEDTNICTICPTEYPILYNGSCYTENECPDKTYFDNIEQNCLNCSVKCLTCEYAPENCSSCNITSEYPFYYNYDCLSECPENYQPDYINNKVCEEYNCSGLCLTCGIYNNETVCTSCFNDSMYPYFVIGQYQCVNQCPDDTWLNKNQSTCVSCNDNPEMCIVEAKSFVDCLLSPQMLTLAILVGLVLTWILISTWKFRYSLNLHSSLMGLLAPIEFIAKVFMIIEFWDQKNPVAVITLLVSIIMNGFSTFIFKILYIEIYELQQLSLITDFSNSHKTLFKFIILLMHAFGPIMFKLLHSGLLWLPKANFEKDLQFRSNFNKVLTYSFILLCSIIILDCYSIGTINYKELVFSLSFVDASLNIVIGLGYIYEYVTTFRQFKYIRVPKNMEKNKIT